jgi:hypothetical protein
MALNTHASIATWNAMLNALAARLNGGFVQIYSGVQPATPDAALGGATLLCVLTISPTAFGAAAGGSASANPLGLGLTVLATGLASFFRAFASDDLTAVIDGSVGSVAGGTVPADMVINNTSLVAGIGMVVQCNAWTISMPVAQ